MYYDGTYEQAYRTEIAIIRRGIDTTATSAVSVISQIRVWVTETFDRYADPFLHRQRDFDREDMRRELNLRSWRARASVPSIPPGLLGVCASPPSTIRPRPALEPAPVWCGRRTRRADRKHVPTRGRHKPRVWERDA